MKTTNWEEELRNRRNVCDCFNAECAYCAETCQLEIFISKLLDSQGKICSCCQIKLEDGQTVGLVSEQIRKALDSQRAKLISEVERFIIPAESSRGQGGLPLYGTVKDWEIHLTKDGWNHIKGTLDQLNKRKE